MYQGVAPGSVVRNILYLKSAQCEIFYLRLLIPAPSSDNTGKPCCHKMALLRYHNDKNLVADFHARISKRRYKPHTRHSERHVDNISTCLPYHDLYKNS
uniref:Uncharacterized protein n=1 Tax=Pararge aegeria TaxID=116150 RepID=S4P2C1_9NEOP